MFTQEEKEIIEYGKQNGKSADEVKKALAQYRAKTGYQPPAQPTQPADTIGSRVSGVINRAGANVADAIDGEGKYAGESSIRRGVEATAQAFNAVPGTVIAASPKPVRSALGWVGEKVGGAFNWATDKISDIPALQKWTMEHPEAAKALEEVAGTAKAGGEIAGTILLADQTAKGLQAVSNKVGTGKVTGYNVENIPTDVGNAVQSVKTKFGAVGQEASDAISRHLNSAQQSLKNIDTKTLTSLGGEKALIKQTQTNIVDGLRGQGLTDAADRIAKLNVDDYATLSEYTNAINRVSGSFGEMKASAIGLREKVQSVLAKKSADPQLQTSAERLSTASQDPRFLKGAIDRVDDPVVTYDKYLSQSQKALSDIKADPAIATVGEKMGDAFKSVIEQRRAVGKVMGDELKGFSGKPVDITGQVSSFQDDLIGSGARYDALTGKVSLTEGSKFTQTDLKILQKYADDMKSLTQNPTAGNVDSFLSRIPNEIKELKQTRGINTMTNAERIITKNLNATRPALEEVATPAYMEARSTYRDLSDFIDEGSGYLGKVTQSGDFAKDASIAKSAVQSILNNGKKDWMLKLEDLTGYNATDDAVIALQAMKDAGDFRGLSLLETMSAQIPTSANGITQRVIDWTLQNTARAVVGSPAEQTRAFLSSLRGK